MPSFDVIIPEGQQRFYDRLHFSPATRLNQLVFVSGVIGTGDDGAISDDPAGQFAALFANLAVIAQAAGAELADVVEMTSYHVNLREHIRLFIAAKDAAIHQPYPAWTAIGCTELFAPNALAEVKATIAIP